MHLSTIFFIVGAVLSLFGTALAVPLPVDDLAGPITAHLTPTVTHFWSTATLAPTSQHMPKKFAVRGTGSTSSYSKLATGDVTASTVTRSRTIAAKDLKALLHASPQQSDILLGPLEPVPKLPEGCMDVEFAHSREPISVIVCSQEDEDLFLAYVRNEQHTDDMANEYKHDMNDRDMKSSIMELLDKSGEECVDVVLDHNFKPMMDLQHGSSWGKARLCGEKEKKEFKVWMRGQIKEDHRLYSIIHRPGDVTVLDELQYNARQRTRDKDCCGLERPHVQTEIPAPARDPKPVLTASPKESKAFLERRAIDDGSGCINVTFEHGWTLEKRLCDKKAKKDFKKFAKLQMKDEHKTFRKEHDQADRNRRKEIWDIIDNKTDLKGPLIPPDDFNKSNCVEITINHDPEPLIDLRFSSLRATWRLCGEKQKKRFKKYYDKAIRDNHKLIQMEHNDNDAIIQKQISDTINNATKKENPRLTRRDVSANTNCRLVLHDHGMERIEKEICSEEEVKAFKKQSEAQGVIDRKNIMKAHTDSALRWIKQKLGMRNSSLDHVDGKDVNGKKVPVRRYSADKMIVNALYWTPEKWLKKYKKQVGILDRTQEGFDDQQKNKELRGTEKEKEANLIRRDGTASLPEQDNDLAGFNTTSLRNLSEQPGKDGDMVVPVASTISSLDAAAMKAFLDGIYNGDSDSDDDGDEVIDEYDDEDDEDEHEPANISSPSPSDNGIIELAPVTLTLTSSTLTTATMPYTSAGEYAGPSTPSHVAYRARRALSTTTKPPYQFSVNPALKTSPITGAPSATTTNPMPGWTSVMDGKVWVQIGHHGPHSAKPRFDMSLVEHRGPPTASQSSMLTERLPSPDQAPAWSKAALIGPKASSRTAARLPQLADGLVMGSVTDGGEN